MNKDAGRGGPLIVTVRLQDGEELPLIVDTGTSGTFLDESLAPKLGKPIGQETVQHWGKYTKKELYAAPELYLAGVRLMTGGSVMTLNSKQFPRDAGQPVMGVLGLDVLEHYCIQFDFAAGKVRILDDKEADKQTWGTAFPIIALNTKDDRPAVSQNLFGAQGPHSLIDSGYMSDGWLMPIYYQQWTNHAVRLPNGKVHSPLGRFGEHTYQDVSLDENNVESDGIGLRFLARHLVTLDFPGHTMYLKRTSDSPLVPRNVEAAAKSAGNSVVNLMVNLNKNSRMPGWSKNDRGNVTGIDFHYTGEFINSITVKSNKNGESSIYHYAFTRASKSSPWKLQKAWRTDQNGEMLEEYPVPQEPQPR